MASSRREISTKLLKLLLLGNSTVGKTSLMLRFCEDAFTLNFSPTIGVGKLSHCPAFVQSHRYPKASAPLHDVLGAVYLCRRLQVQDD